ncbi:vacuolar proton-ATPase-like protein [Trypanosoma theileri]|uniref:V-type proton ATPase subunit a n=1 Tax=Trypanosoma theileri TaxID=67003 RepID=A0A1X0NV83_9TRYP|nr:vacuolar proton-ATPase-like protein [Trypanosoma theileri]ORC88403.1 vacuolar proton-ATPase-like protein [Trypanosoma theileri]
MPQERASGLWRSEDMVRLNIITQREAFYDTVVCIGLLGKAQFVDVCGDATVFGRPYTAEIRRCDDLDRELRFLMEEFEREKCLTEEDVLPVNTTDDIWSLLHSSPLDEAEERINAMTSELRAVNASLEELRREINYHHELYLLHLRLKELLPSQQEQSLTELLQTPYLIGMIDATKTEVLYAMVYRATKGNAFVELDNKPAMLLDTTTGISCVAKTSFIIFTPSVSAFKGVERYLLSLGATLHTIGNASLEATEDRKQAADELNQMYEEVQSRKRDLLKQHARSYFTLLQLIKMRKRVFSTMNLCTVSGATCTASVWIPRKYEDALRASIRKALHVSSGEVLSVVTPHASQKNPPTYFETNAFTECFQGIVNSYGMARYKEVNPGVFTIVTFPYLFGIMYGDMGHGMLLLFFALFFIVIEIKWRGHKKNEMLAMLLSGRYLLLLMALFSIYMGALYNDFFGFSIGLFSSAYVWPPINEQNGMIYPLENVTRSHVYPLGIDVAWTETENKLEFYNSVKMKCAVIVGVIQMLTGNILSLLNYIYNNDYPKICFLFIPEVVFLLCTFGYMSILIVIKWCTKWENTNEAPSILEIMTNFFLQPGTVNQSLFKGQAIVQIVLLLLSVAMIPVMLVMMPVIEVRRHRKRMRYFLHSRTGSLHSLGEDGRRHNKQDSQSDFHAEVVVSQPNLSGTAVIIDEYSKNTVDDIYSLKENSHTEGGSVENEEELVSHFELSEVVIHYIIHTIEYVLGCVSNTASYLRLWALSLAHAQLSEVFFTFAVVKVLSLDTTGVFIAGGIAIWLAVTVAVLVGMEALSAFLHALRLHWVEFNNKFYAADGVASEPFDLMQPQE